MRNKNFNKYLKFIIGVFFTGLFLSPYIYMVIMAFQTRSQIFGPLTIFFRPTLNNFRQLLVQGFFLNNLHSSIIVVGGSVVVGLILAVPAAYGFARFNFKGNKDLSFWVLSIRMVPPIAVVIPYFLIGSFLGLIDTHIILVITYLTFNIPFAIWMLKGFFEDIPISLEEQARVDGCSRIQAFIKIMLPLIAPGMGATAILIVIQSWNHFVYALFLTSTSARTLPTMVTRFMGFTGVAWGPMAAASTLSTIPVVIFAILFRKKLIQGLTFGAVKG